MDDSVVRQETALSNVRLYTAALEELNAPDYADRCRANEERRQRHLARMAELEAQARPAELGAGARGPGTGGVGTRGAGAVAPGTTAMPPDAIGQGTAPLHDHSMATALAAVGMSYLPRGISLTASSAEGKVLDEVLQGVNPNDARGTVVTTTRTIF
jgi:hypothetical protein